MISVVANLKGGSGKSTVAFNLALWLQAHGQEVVAYDLDPQCTLSDVAEVRQQEMYEPGLQVLRDDGITVEKIRQHTCDVLIDVGAANMDGMIAALAAADKVILPVPPSQPDVWATQRFLEIVETATPLVDGRQIYAFVNRADTHRSVRESDETAEALTMLGDIEVLSQRLGQRTAFRRSLSEGMSVLELSPRSKAADEFKQLAGRIYLSR